MILLVLLSGILILPAVMASELKIDDAAFTALGQDQTIAIKVADVPYGLSGCIIHLKLQDPLVEIVSVQYRWWGTLYLTSPLPSSDGCYLLVADTLNQVPQPSQNVVGIADITLRSLAAGTTTLLADSYEIKDDNNVPYSVTVTGGAITVTVPDTTPPGPVTNIQHTATQNSITWMWVKPTDADFDHLDFRILNGAGDVIHQGTLSKTETTYTVDSLNPGDVRTIKLRTVDTSGNKGTWVTDTATAQATAIGYGTLDASSSPRGAAVWIGNVRYGFTNGRFRVPAGMQQVTFTYGGMTKVVNVYIPPNGIVSVNVILP